MKRRLLPVLLLFYGSITYGQVGIGLKQPDVSAALDIKSSNRGVLIPKIHLQNIYDKEVINGGNPVEGLLVFNTNTVDNTLVPGFYFWAKNPLESRYYWTRLKTTEDINSGSSAGNESLYVKDNKLHLRDTEGHVVSIELSELQKEDVVTGFTNNGQGVYIYTNEENKTFTIDVISDVQNNFEEIINHGDIQEILNKYITDNPPKGSVTYVKEGDKYVFKYTDESGKPVEIDMSALVKQYETNTTLTALGKGKYEYKNEDQIKNNKPGTVISVVEDVQNNFEEIINHGDIQEILNKYITDNPPKGSVTYVKEGDKYVFKYTDESGNPVEIDMSALVKQYETNTTLTALGKGKYEYKNEDQIKNNKPGTFIEVVADVQNNFEEIINKEEVQQVLNMYFTKNFNGNVTYNNGDFFVTKEDGNGNVTTTVIDFKALVQKNETETFLENKGEGIYIYTNEKDKKVTVNVIKDVEDNFQTIVNNPDVQIILKEFIANTQGDVTIGKNSDGDIIISNGKDTYNITKEILAKEAVTLLNKKGKGIYEYLNEDQIKNNQPGTIISVVEDVQNNFEEIINHKDIQEILNKYITENPPKGSVTYVKEGDRYVFKYLDEAGKPIEIDMSALVKLHETVTTLTSKGNGNYEYKNENQIKNNENGTFIRVVEDVQNNFQEIINEQSVQDILNQYITTNPPKGSVYYINEGTSLVFKYYNDKGDLVEIDMSTLVKQYETVTTLSGLGKGTYEYKNEDQIKNNKPGTLVKVVEDVQNNFEEIINHKNVEKILQEFISTATGDVSIERDINGDIVIKDLKSSYNITEEIRNTETVTTLTNQGKGKYEYRNENQIKKGESGTFIKVVEDVQANFDQIIKDKNVQNILNEYFTNFPPKEGSVTYVKEGDKFVFKYIDEKGDPVSIDMEAIIKLYETETTITVKKDKNVNTGEYIYLNEKNKSVTINVIADVQNNFQKVIDKKEVQDILNQFITENPPKGSVTYVKEGDSYVFKYIDDSGKPIDIDMSTLVKQYETVTTLTKLAKGQYEYKNEDQVKANKPGVIIDVVTDVLNNFEEIFNNTEIQDIINKYITENPPKGNVTYVKEGDKYVFKYVDDSGKTVELDMSSVVKQYETNTTLSVLGKGKYEYKNEDQIKKGLAGTQITVVEDVQNNFEEIINKTEVQDILNQFLMENVEGNVTYVNGEFFYTVKALDGTVSTEKINMQQIVRDNETLTTITAKKNATGANSGEYVYLNEKNQSVIITVVADVQNNFQKIIDKKEVQDILNQYFINYPPKGSVVYVKEGDHYVLKYYDEDGDPVEINIEDIIKKHETNTTLTAHGKGKYEYRNEEQIKKKLPGTFIEVVADVQNNFEEIINHKNVQNILNQYITDNPPTGIVVYVKEGDEYVFKYIDDKGDPVAISVEPLVKKYETETTLTPVKRGVDNNTGEYIYVNEKNKTTKITVLADVKNNFDQIINDQSVQNILNKYITENPPKGSVTYVKEGDNHVFKYIDENGQPVAIDMTQVVKQYETLTTLTPQPKGVYVYKNEKGTDVSINVVTDVQNNFEEIINKTEVQDILNQYLTDNIVGNVTYVDSVFYYTVKDPLTGDVSTKTIDMQKVVRDNETITTLTPQPKGVYVYKNEGGTDVSINVVTDVQNNFEEIINKTEVKDILNQYLNDNVVGNVTYVDEIFYYTVKDPNTGDVSSKELNIGAIVTLHETKTTITPEKDANDKNLGKYVYLNEDKLPVAITVVEDVQYNFQTIVDDPNVQTILKEFISKSTGDITISRSAAGDVIISDGTNTFNITDEVKAKETNTNLANLTGGKYEYKNEEQIKNNLPGTLITVVEDVQQNFQTIVDDTTVQEILKQFIANSSGDVTIKYDTNGDLIISDIVKSYNITQEIRDKETLTTLSSLGKGKYEYKNEDQIKKGEPGTVITVLEDVQNNFEEIINKTEVQDILNQFFAENIKGNVTYVNGKFFYTVVDGNGQTTSEEIKMDDLVKLYETNTVLSNLTKGRYEYKNEEQIKKGKAGVFIEVLADVKNNFEEIINTTEVKDILNQFFKENVEGNVTYINGEFFYTVKGDNGDVTTTKIDFKQLVKDNETLTTLKTEPKGVYVYKNEAGTEVSIKVLADVQNNFGDIINNQNVQDVLNQYIHNNPPKGVVVYLEEAGEFVFKYVGENGELTLIDISAIVKQYETNTILNIVGKGKYEYKNEEQIKKGEKGTFITVLEDVQNNFEQVINNQNVQDILNEYITNHPPLGNVTYVKEGDIYVFKYIDEAGHDIVLELDQLVKQYETNTTLTNLGKGKYEYKNENQIKKGEKGTFITVVEDVQTNFEQIINNENVQKFLNQYLTEHPVIGNVTYVEEGGSFVFKYVDKDGITQVLDMGTIVKSYETLTTLAATKENNINTGEYTYLNEKQQSVKITVVADVQNNFQKIIDKKEVQDILNQYITTNPPKGSVTYVEEGDTYVFKYIDDSGKPVEIDIASIVKLHETNTTLVNKGKGQYEYKNEDQIKKGTAGTMITVVEDVQQNFQDIVNNQDVQNILKQFISTVTGEVTISRNTDGDIVISDGTNTFNITSEIKAKETNTTLVNKGKGEYEYKNEDQIKKGTAGTLITVVKDVQNNFEEIINNQNVQDILNEYITNHPPQGNVTYIQEGNTYVFKYVDDSGQLMVIDMESIVKQYETLTTVTANKNAKGKNSGDYVYLNEKKQPVNITVVADVQNNFQKVIDNQEVQDILNEYITNHPPVGNVTYVQEGNIYVFKYLDGNGDMIIIDMAGVVKQYETLTTITPIKDKGVNTGEYVYANEKQQNVSIKVVEDVQNNFQKIIDKKEVQDILNQYITTNPPKGSVTYVEEGDTFVFKYIDQSGQPVTIDMSAIVKQYETITWMEHKVATVVEETPSGDIEKKEHSLLYHGENADDPRNKEIKISELIKGSETITKLDYDTDKGVITYRNEVDEVDEIPLASLVRRYETKTNLRIDQDSKILLFNNESGKQQIDLSPIIQEPWYQSGTTEGATSNTQDIYTNGWVGIGYDKPSSAPNEKLRVNGSITATNSYYADYVFENYFTGYSNLKYDYNFKNLKVVEEFIKKNMHLPGITPISELKKVESGYSFNLSELSIQLLEKTEELYLHTIDQEKKIETLESELNQVNKQLEESQEELNLLKERLQTIENLILNQSNK